MNINDANLKNILSAISKVNHILNEQITLFFISSKTQCPDCAYDPILKESTNPFCPTCGGDGWIEDRTSITIPASVEEEEDVDDIEITKVGKFEPKIIYVTIDKEEIDKHEIDVNKIEKISWQDVNYEIKRKQWGSLQGNKYEINMKLKRL